MRRIAELAPPEAISAGPAWGQHLQDTADVAEASLDDLAWADAVLFGTPTRFGNPASQLRAFIETTGGLWREGTLTERHRVGLRQTRLWVATLRRSCGAALEHQVRTVHRIMMHTML